MAEKVIVIGAGMAGIMAARTLHDAGLDVTILEARNRVGGRTHTDHSLGASVDLGAAWIHGRDGNPLAPLAKKLNIENGHTDFLNRSGTAVQAYDEDGTPLDPAEYAHGLQLGLASFYKAAGSLLYDRPVKRESLKDWVEHGLPKSEGLSHAAEQGFFYQSLISSEYVSAADWDELSMNDGRYIQLPGGDYLLHGGGFNVITDHLVEGLDVRLETAVTHIKQSSDQIILYTTRGSFTCDCLIITVPLGVLKSGNITFEPPLPAEKWEVIQRIGFGKYEKLVMRFDKFYWPKAQERFNYMSMGEPSLFHAWLNIGHYTDEPIIASYHAGRRARHINQMSDGDLVEGTVDAMQTMFGDEFGEIPAPISFARTSWETDTYSCGSYSFNHVNQASGDREMLGAAVNGRLFFAGEATHPYFYATVHGAYETGIYAAKQVIRKIGNE